MTRHAPDADAQHPWAVLYIDDNPANLAVLDRFLTDRGFEVLVAQDSASGLQRAERAQPDLILLDVFLPDRDGFETCRILKADPRTQHIPVIFVTAIADDIQYKLRGFELGAVDYITKPFEEVEVLARITTHLRLLDLTRRLQHQAEELQQEVNERERAEARLQAYREHLEELVEERTAELTAANQQLQREMAERRQAQAALKESEFFLRRSQAVGQIGSYYLDARAGTWISSPALDEIFGIDDSFVRDVAGWISLVHPEQRDEMWRYFVEEVLGARQRFDREYRIVRRDTGQERWMHGIGELEFDAGGTPIKMIGTIQDITERKRAEEALQLTRFSIDSVSDAVYWIDADTRIVDVNEAACLMIGYSRSELLERSVIDLDPDLTWETWQQMWQQLWQRPPSERLVLETRHRTKDGRLLIVEVVANRIAFGGREFNCAVVRDITERKRVEAELRTSEARYRALVQSQIDLISRYRPDTTLTFVNDAYCQFYGKTREELIGLSYLTMVAPEFHAQALQETENFLKDPRPISGEYQNYRWDGQPCWIHWILQGIVDESGQVVEIQASGRDITALKEAEQQIKDSLYEKEIMLKEIHHRVKNNLQVISSLLYLQSRHIDVPELVELFREGQNRISSMSLVHEMLYQSEDYAHVDFMAYLQTLTSSLLATYGVDQRRIKMLIEVPDVRLSINLAIPCGLIVNEVVSNALKHAFPDGRQGQIRVELGRQGSTYELTMADDGIGFSPETRARPNTLGLRLIDRLVHQLNGTIERGGRPGTTYRVTFPADS